MHIHDMTEQAYKNGYKAGVKEFAEKVRKLWGNYDGYSFEIRFDELLEEMVGDSE